MSLKYLTNDNRRDLAKQFGSAPVFNPNNHSNPPRVLLRDCPILAQHWFGVDREVV